MYVDGGISDPLPVHFARSLGDVVIIASDITPSLDGFDAESLPQVVRKSFEVTYQRLAYTSQQEADILLKMDFTDIDSPIADDANHKLYERGRESVCSQSEQIRKIVSK